MRPVALTIAGALGVLLRLASSGPDSYQYRHPTPFTRWLSTPAFDRLLQQLLAGVDTSNVFQWAPDAAHAAYAAYA